MEIKIVNGGAFMYIYNVKLNGGIVLRIIIGALSLFMLVVFFISIYRIFFTSGSFKINDQIQPKEITEIQAENYTNILQAVHDNLDSYVGMKIKFTGYLYRVFDFSEEEFVLARDMFINNEKTQTVVVGFLCQYKDADNLQNGEWINIIGTIEKGKYHNEEIPIIKVTDVQKTEEPKERYVSMPSNTYVPTNGIF